jgi:hypothetical protein
MKRSLVSTRRSSASDELALFTSSVGVMYAERAIGQRVASARCGAREHQILAKVRLGVRRHVPVGDFVVDEESRCQIEAILRPPLAANSRTQKDVVAGACVEAEGLVRRRLFCSAPSSKRNGAVMIMPPKPTSARNVPSSVERTTRRRRVLTWR